jgi:hypothetical protein
MDCRVEPGNDGDTTMQFAGMNYLAILAAAVAAWMFGAVYYGTVANAWVAALGRTMADFKAEQAAKTGKLGAIGPYILSFFAELLMAWVLAGVIAHLGPVTVKTGVVSALFIWAGFVLTTMATNNAYTGRKPMLTVIDAAHWFGALVIMGAIIGVMGV